MAGRDRGAGQREAGDRPLAGVVGRGRVVGGAGVVAGACVVDGRRHVVEGAGVEVEAGVGDAAVRVERVERLLDAAVHELAPELHAVNVDTREGDLAKFSKGDLVQGLLAGTPFEYARDFRGLSRPASQEEKATIEPARWLLFLALYLLFVEQMLAWNFRYGLCLLFPPAIPFVWRSLRN